MRQFFAISAFAKDRPGIIADVAGLVYESGCNLEDSGMTILENLTAFLAIVSGEAEGLGDRLNNGAKRLEWDKGIVIFVSPIEEVRARSEDTEHFARYELSTIGLDRAGIVFRVSQFLADKGINIADMKTHTQPSPDTGTPVFNMLMHIEVPRDLERGEIEKELNAIGDQLAVDILISPVDEPRK